jgi:iron complex outermembrane recepter protein
MKRFARMAYTAIAVAMPYAAQAANADDPRSPDQDNSLDPITVVSPIRSPGQASWRTNDLAPGRETGDLLRDMAGVSGSRMGGHGTDPVIRGLGQTRINVLLDGAFVHGACPNRMDPPTAYAPASGYDRIIVIRGVNTLEYGGGPGGSVLLERETSRFVEDEGPRGQFRAGYRGNSNSTEASVDLSAGKPAGFLRVLGSWLDADDYDDGAGNPVRSAFEERSAGVIAGWTPDDHTRLEFSAEGQRLRDELFAGAGMDSPKSDNDVFRLKYGRAELGALSSLKAELAISRVDHVMDNYSLREPPSPMMRMRAPASSDTDSGRLVGEIEHGDQRWRFGLAVQNNARDAIRVNDFNGMLNSLLWPGVSIDQTGVFFEHHLALSGRQRLISGLRYDRVRARASRTDGQPDGNLLSPNALYALYYGPNADGRRRTEHNGSGLLRFERDMSGLPGTWYAGLSRTVRTADATERYIASNAAMPSGRWVGNPTLNPERHHQAELGLFLRKNGWDLEGSLFFNDISDYILRDRFRESGNMATVYRNIDARLWGGEFSAGLRFADGWRADLGLGYVRARNRDDGRPIAQTPPLEASAGLEYRAERWQASIRALAAGRQRRVDDDPSTGSGLDSGQTPGWVVFNLGARYELSPRWLLDLGVDNLFDREYAQHLNRASAFDAEQVQVSEPGRSSWVRLSTQF